MFANFQKKKIATSGAEINLVWGGQGPPLLLLHGHPQTHVMWHKIAPKLAEDFTVIATDLRGYGDSSKPVSDKDHFTYSKRCMAQDQVEIMETLGFSNFFVAGHDRGARVVHRLVLDFPGKVKKAVVLDIAPTLSMYRNTTESFAKAYYHWFFLIQPEPMPERLIGSDPDFFLLFKLSNASSGLTPFTKPALEEYLRCFRDPNTIHAICEDYRASNTIDLVHDETDLERFVECPLLVLWGKYGVIEECFDPIKEWEKRAKFVKGKAMNGGHFLAEELPREIEMEIRDFFLS